MSPSTLNEFRFGYTNIDYLYLVTDGQAFPFHDRPSIDYGQQSNMPQGRDERHLVFATPSPMCSAGRATTSSGSGESTT